MNGLRRVAVAIGIVFGRSFFPFAALSVILGTLLWDPWVSLLFAVILWELAGFIA